LTGQNRAILALVFLHDDPLFFSELIGSVNLKRIVSVMFYFNLNKKIFSVHHGEIPAIFFANTYCSSPSFEITPMK
jgi:hypothetical protein